MDYSHTKITTLLLFYCLRNLYQSFLFGLPLPDALQFSFGYYLHVYKRALIALKSHQVIVSFEYLTLQLMEVFQYVAVRYYFHAVSEDRWRVYFFLYLEKGLRIQINEHQDHLFKTSICRKLQQSHHIVQNRLQCRKTSLAFVMRTLGCMHVLISISFTHMFT